MTACNNNVRGGKASRVITAALVATLSVGTPMAAIASTVSEGGVDMLATNASDIKGGTVSFKSGKDGDSFTYNGKEQAVVPSTLTPVNSKAQKLSLLPATNREAGYYYYYIKLDASGDQNFAERVSYVDQDGDTQWVKGYNVQSSSAGFYTPFEVGSYVVMVGYWEGGVWNYVDDAAFFQITPQSLENATLFDGDDVSDSEFEFTGKDGNLQGKNILSRLGVALDGKQLKEGEDYSLKLYLYGSKTEITGADTNVYNPGTKFTAVITGLNNRYSSDTVQKTFTMEKFDLSSATIVANTSDSVDPSTFTTNGSVSTQNLSSLIKSVNGIAYSDLSPNLVNYIVANLSDGPNGSILDAKKGAYNYSVSASTATANKFVEGNADSVTYMYADKLASVNFGNSGVDPDGNGGFVVDLADKDAEHFDLSDISVTVSNQKIDSDKYDVTITKADGTTATAEDLEKPGTYTITVTVNYKDSNKKVIAGSDSTTVTVKYGVTQDANVFMAYDGDNVVRGTSDEYDGSNLAKKMSFKVTAGDSVLTEGTDYEVKFQKINADGSKSDVDEIVDAGDYIITVKGLSFDESFTFDFEVTPIKVTTIRPVYTFESAAGNFMKYTGDTIVPEYEYKNTDGDWVALPSDVYTAEYYFKGEDDSNYSEDPVEAVKEVGSYKAELTTAEDIENYVVDATCTFGVSDIKVYSDVPNNEWFSQDVYDARTFMSGYAGTSLFGPHDNLTRAQACIVLYNMASMDKQNFDFSVDNQMSWDSGYSDVNESAYYAKAIAWAKANGIATGYAGTDFFGPDDNISREQFAQMLANFAKKTGEYEAVDTDTVLSGYEDAASVSDWAKDAVAWAASVKIMGNGAPLSAGTAIERAQVASMGVRFLDVVDMGSLIGNGAVALN